MPRIELAEADGDLREADGGVQEPTASSKRRQHGRWGLSLRDMDIDGRIEHHGTDERVVRDEGERIILTATEWLQALIGLEPPKERVELSGQA